MNWAKRLLIAAILAVVVGASLPASDLYPSPSYWSLGELARWAQPRVASGTSLPAVASAAEGDIYVLASSPAPIWYRLHVGTWTAFAGSSGGTGGTSDVGGDLSGTTATATVTKIQNNPVASHTPTTLDTLVWDGSGWTATYPIPVRFVTGYPSTIPATGSLGVVVDPVSSAAQLLVVVSGASTTATATDQIPTMTSQNAPSGLCSQVESYTDTYKAFDNDDSTYATVTNENRYVQYQASATFQCVTLRLLCGHATAVDPADFRLEGSTNGSTWTVLKKVTGETWGGVKQWKEYAINATASYDYHRVWIDTSNSGSNYTYWYAIELIATSSTAGPGWAPFVASIPVAIAHGGTGATTAAGARAALDVPSTASLTAELSLKAGINGTSTKIFTAQELCSAVIRADSTGSNAVQIATSGVVSFGNNSAVRVRDVGSTLYANASTTVASFGAEIQDAQNEWSGSEFIPTVTGKRLFSGFLRGNAFLDVSSGSRLLVTLHENDALVAIIGINHYDVANRLVPEVVIFGSYTCTAGAKYTVRVTNNLGVNWTVATDIYYANLDITKIR